MSEVPNDAELLRRYARDRDEGAFAELVRRYVSLVYHAAERQLGGESHAAEDVTQKVFTLLARKASSLGGHTALAGWLHATTRFVARDVLRAERRRRAREQEAYLMSEPSDGSASGEAWERLRPMIDEAVTELSERDREAVLLRFFAGLSLGEIGARLNISDNAARMRVDRALDKLRGALARRGVASTATALGSMLTTQAAVVGPAGLAGSVTSVALAGAASVGAAAVGAGMVGFMNASKIAVSVAAACAAISVGVALQQHAVARRAELAQVQGVEEREKLRSHVADLEARIGAAEQRARSAEARSAALQREVEEKRKAVSVAKVARSEVTESDEEQLDRLVAKRPDLQELYIRQQTVRFPMRYGPLYAALGLSELQVTEFERVMTRFAQAKVDVPVAALQQGLPKRGDVSEKLLTEAREERDRGLRALLGETGFEAYQWHEKTEGWRNIADMLAGRMYFTDEPLTGRAGEELTRIAVETGRRNGGRVDWPALMREAKNVLSAKQWAALDNHRELLENGAKVHAITKPVLAENGDGSEEAKLGR